jgi:hypothetical protein
MNMTFNWGIYVLCISEMLLVTGSLHCYVPVSYVLLHYIISILYFWFHTTMWNRIYSDIQGCDTVLVAEWCAVFGRLKVFFIFRVKNSFGLINS